MLGEQGRAVGRADAVRDEQVLDPDRHPVRGTQLLPAHDRPAARGSSSGGIGSAGCATHSRAGRRDGVADISVPHTLTAGANASDCRQMTTELGTQALSCRSVTRTSQDVRRASQLRSVHRKSSRSSTKGK
jgi:hypothetical protein